MGARVGKGFGLSVTLLVVLSKLVLLAVLRWAQVGSGSDACLATYYETADRGVEVDLRDRYGSSTCPAMLESNLVAL